MSRNRTLGAPYEQLLVSSDFTTEHNTDRYLVVTPGAGPAVTATLDPNAFEGDQVTILDVSGNAGTFPITIVPSPGQDIFGAASISSDGGSIELTFISIPNVGSGWTVQSGSASPVGTPARVTAVGPAVPVPLPVVDGPIAVCLTLPTITAPVGSTLNISGYLQIVNTTAMAQSGLQVEVELAAGGGGSILPLGLFTRASFPMGPGFYINVPFNGDYVTTTETTDIVITAFQPGGTPGSLNCGVNGSVAVVMQVP